MYVVSRPAKLTITEWTVSTAPGAGGGVFNGALCALFQNPITPTENTPFASFTPADFNGYAPSAALVWGSPFLSPNGVWCVSAPSVLFTPTDGLVQNTIYGYYIVNPGNTDWLAATRFDTPFLVLDDTTPLQLIPTISPWSADPGVACYC